MRISRAPGRRTSVSRPNSLCAGLDARALASLLLVGLFATQPVAAGELEPAGDRQEAEPAPGAAVEPDSAAPSADPDRLRVFERLEVRERADDLVGVADAASEGTTGAADLALRPILRAGELVESVPGLIATQHSGGGKANQYFVRGFNLDHGTDLAIAVAGVPVNMPSHGHGQGYADLNFLIPELVDRVAFRKGTYAAEEGDFSAAGAVAIDLVRTLPEGFVELTAGGYGYRRALVAESLAAAGGDLVAALEAGTYDGPWRRGDDFDTEVYLSWGRGFHSNDARGATIRVDPVSGEPAPRVDPLVPAEGAEIGVRTAALPGLQSTLALFSLELDSELVFVGDGGATEASRPSRRLGVEWTNHYRPRPWLALDLDAAVAEAEFTDRDPAGEEIPGALEHVVSAGVGIDGLGRWSGGLRLRWFSGYPLIEDDSVRAGSTALLNARVAWRATERLTLALEGFNLLDREDSDIEYFYASRLPGEPEEGVEDVHFHPVEKPSARLSASWRF